MAPLTFVRGPGQEPNGRWCGSGVVRSGPVGWPPGESVRWLRGERTQRSEERRVGKEGGSRWWRRPDEGEGGGGGARRDESAERGGEAARDPGATAVRSHGAGNS